MKMGISLIMKISLLSILFMIYLPSCSGGSGSSSGGGGSIPFGPNATLELLPNAGSYQVGDSFNIDIFVNTDGQNVTVAGARIKYDPTHFRVNSIDTSDSVFTMEVEKEIDTINGIIKIVRGITSPAVNTKQGKVARLNLTGLSPISPGADNITLLFTPGSTGHSNVILDDGLGTAILSIVFNAKITVS